MTEIPHIADATLEKLETRVGMLVAHIRDWQGQDYQLIFDGLDRYRFEALWGGDLSHIILRTPSKDESSEIGLSVFSVLNADDEVVLEVWAQEVRLTIESPPSC